MTAPTKDRDAIRNRWRERLKRVDSHITQAFVHRHIWQSVRDEIVRVNPTSDGQFVESCTRVYAESIMLTIRRLADTDDNTDSLWALWAAIRANNECATRADYIASAVALVEPHDAASAAAQSDRHFTESFGTGSHVDRDKIDLYQASLANDAERVKVFVDKRIAHLDPIVDHPAAQSIDLGEIHGALDRVAANTNEVHRLLDRQYQAFDLVVVPPGWRASMRFLFPPPQERRPLPSG